MEKKPVGRPPIFKTVEELQLKIDSYFQNCPDKRKIMVRVQEWKSKYKVEHEVDCPTITGLALHLGFCDRQSFYDYKEKEEFSCTIKKARTFIEREYEKLLQSNPTGAIFALKNFWRTDKQEIHNTGEVTYNINSMSSDELLALVKWWQQ